MRTIEQPTQKIDILDGAVIVAGTGEIGLGQRFSAITKTTFQESKFRSSTPIDLVTNLSQRVLNNFGTTFFTNLNHHIPFGALMTFQNGGTAHLCEFQLENMRPELKTNKLWYCSMGSGQLIVDPFLSLMRKTFWNDGPPTRQDATFAVMWALLHAIECNPGGIGEPIQIGELTKDVKGQPRARLLDEHELAEHRQNVSEAIDHLRSYRGKFKGDQPTQVPEVPKPATTAPAAANPIDIRTFRRLLRLPQTCTSHNQRSCLKRYGWSSADVSTVKKFPLASTAPRGQNRTFTFPCSEISP